MKKVIALLLTALCLSLAACTKPGTTETQTASVPQSTAAAPERTETDAEHTATDTEQSDYSDAVERFGLEDLLMLVGAEAFQFDDPAQLSADALYHFAVHLLQSEYDYESWFDGENYRIPGETFRELIRRGLDFDPTPKLEEVEGYDKAQDVIVVPVIGGYGGVSNVKLLSAEKENGVVTVTVDDCDQNDVPIYRVTFRIREEADRYVFLSENCFEYEP